MPFGLDERLDVESTVENPVAWTLDAARLPITGLGSKTDSAITCSWEKENSAARNADH
jgi:hypothetical protein